MSNRQAYGKKANHDRGVKVEVARANVDLQVLAVEYEKLLDQEIFFMLDNGEAVQLQFKRDNFFHLLGFHKLKDVSVIKAIEEATLDKATFLKYIRSGEITYTSLDIEIDKKVSNPVIHIKDTEYKEDLIDITENRFNYFSAEMITTLLKHNPIIDFCVEESESTIKADKIFFKLMTLENKHLNLFIGLDQATGKHYPITFFLEYKRGSYLSKKDQSKQSQTRCVSGGIRDLTNLTIKDFYINWGNVRNALKDNKY